MNYTITHNDEHNSIEVAFDGKPAEATRAALKSLRFRWHSVKRVWYGYATEDETRAAIENSADCDAVCATLPTAKTINEGTLYEGWEGGNNHAWHSDKELKQLLLADFKRAGIKASVRFDRAGWLTSITVTLYEAADALKTYEEWLNGDDYREVHSNGYWLYYRDDETGKVQSIHRDVFCKLDQKAPETLALLDSINRYTYQAQVNAVGSEHTYRPNEESVLRPAALARLTAAKAIVASYNRDESNSMVDYFARDIYDHYRVKIA